MLINKPSSFKAKDKDYIGTDSNVSNVSNQGGLENVNETEEIKEIPKSIGERRMVPSGKEPQDAVIQNYKILTSSAGKNQSYVKTPFAFEIGIQK